ncbi:MAG: S41 family peptidase [Planctomycetota bacterium]
MRLLLILLLAPFALAEDEFLWVRYPAISPDGKQICFSYRGDLWLVPAAGGSATPFTTHVGYERSPVWSRDSKRIAFTSDRHGNFDVFLKDLSGGPARRLTHHSTFDVPSDFSPDGERVLFTSLRDGDPKANPASVWMPQLYEIAVTGGRPRLVLPTPALNARWNADGTKLVYESYPGRENAWRKHHTSSVARDIWVYEPATGKHRRHTKSSHEDRDPHWDGDKIIHLCEESGSFNVHGSTRFKTHPVRFLSRAADGTLCFGHHGAVHVMAPGGEPKRITIRGRRADRHNETRTETQRSGATHFAVSPNEKEVAFTVRGELFCASIEHGTTRRLTATASQERSPSWAPDGKTIYFAGERDGAWNLYKVSLSRPEDEYFFRATALKEEPVLIGEDESFQPRVSPDGKRIAYLHNRDEIRVFDIASKNAWTVVPADRNYSYSDGDIGFDWSPDSKWLAFTVSLEGRWLESIGVVDAEGKQLVDMTRSGYWEWRPRWSPDGRALLFISNRLGRRSHGSWGSESDVFALDLTQAAHDHAKLSEEELELRAKKKEDKEEKRTPAVTIEFDGRDRRTRRISLHSASLSDFAISPDGETLVTIARVGDTHGLWKTSWRKGETKRLMKLQGRRGNVEFSKDGKEVFVRSGDGRLFKVALQGEPKPIGFAAQLEIDAPGERAYIFEHAWRQVKRKFYDEKLHGAPWDELKTAYEPMLAQIDNNHDFAEMLSELLGELNASHTGCGYRMPRDQGDQTASLGLLFERGSLEVAEVLKGGPCSRSGVGIGPGCVLTHISGVVLTDATNPSALLNHTAGKRVLIAFTKPDGSKGEAVVEPIPFMDSVQLRYQRWVEQRRALVDKLSGNRIGYVHVRSMNDRSFRHVYQEVLGRYGGREALVVDTRNNGGGNLHDDLLKFLSGRKYATFHPRGKRLGDFGSDPGARWAEPVAVVVNELNYSDAHIFPYIMQKLKVGPVIGSPVAGTGTAVWWERQIDPTLVFGIPQVGFHTGDGKYLENQEFIPDHVVLHHPEAAARGEDEQLAKAVEVLLAKLEK